MKPHDKKQPEDIVWDTITESAKSRFDYTAYKEAFDGYDDDGRMAENALFHIIARYADGQSTSDIISSIQGELFLLGMGFQDGYLENFLKDKEEVLRREIKATKIALESFAVGLKPPGILLSVRSILQKNEPAQQPGKTPRITPKELQGYAEVLFRRSIASTLHIRPDELQSNQVKRSLVEHILQTVIAIGSHATLENAANNLVSRNNVAKTNFTYETALQHAQEVYEQFKYPIGGVERMLKLRQYPIEKLEKIWEVIRARVPIDPDYNDEWMEVADAWILRGEHRTLNLGTARVGHIDDLKDINLSQFLENLED